jgi:hypothetical protein
MKTLIDGQGVEITLNSGVTVKGVVLHEKDFNVKLEIKPTLPHYFIKVDMPLLKKHYKTNDCKFNGEKTAQGGLIPTYFSDDYTLIPRREYIIATVYKSTIREIK